jgi:Carboxypeptidase regulatory-like domain
MLVVATRRPMRTMSPLAKIFASALLLAASASAATVSGRRETLTDDDGRFSFASIVSGSYTLDVRQAGFADLKQTVRVPRHILSTERDRPSR